MSFVDTSVRKTVSLSSAAQGAGHEAMRPLSDTAAPVSFETLDLACDHDARAMWCHLNPPGRPSVTPALLRDLAAMQSTACATYDAMDEASAPRFYVMASRVPGVFNLGGDLGLFAEAIAAGRREVIEEYAYQAIDRLHTNYQACGERMVTIALVQGDALGGGFECALSFDVIVAERRARFGLPEALFSLFPGMGAYSFLARRIGAAQAERMILSGRIYTAEELHALGIVDVLAEDGTGEETVRQYIAQQGRRYNTLRSVLQARRRVFPVTLQELQGVVDIWVDAAMRLQDADLRKMQRLAAAQDRRTAAGRPAGEQADPGRLTAAPAGEPVRALPAHAARLRVVARQ